MPIRPELRHHYRGPAWRAIRERILARAENRCEHCGVPNHKQAWRMCGWWTPSTFEANAWASGWRLNLPLGRHEVNGAAIETLPGDIQLIHLPWRHAGVPEHLACFPAGGHRLVYIVLTIAHLDHNPENNADANLAALCQWCHFRHDSALHAFNARNTRQARKDRARPLLAEAEATTP